MSLRKQEAVKCHWDKTKVRKHSQKKEWGDSVHLLESSIHGPPSSDYKYF